MDQLTNARPSVVAMLRFTGVIAVLTACGDSGGTAPPLPPPPEPVQLLTVHRVSVQTLDTTVVIPVNPDASWLFEVNESRWLDEVPVSRVSRVPTGVAVEVVGPGVATIEVWVPGDNRESATVDVRPPDLIVYGARQDALPVSDDVSVRAYQANRLQLFQVTMDGEPVEAVSQDSANFVVRLPALGGGDCSGSPFGQGSLAVAVSPGLEVEVSRLKGPVATLEVGEVHRVADGRDVCLRIAGPPGARYAVAAVDRSYIDASRQKAEIVRYGGGEENPYRLTVVDRTVSSSAAEEVVGPHAHALHQHGDSPSDPLRFVPPRAHSGGSTPGVQGDVQASTPLAVGNEFHWRTLGGRSGAYQVVALYEPNIAFAVFKADMPGFWDRTRASEIDEIFTRLGSTEVQDLYKVTFGPEPPVTNPNTGQMLVMFHADVYQSPTGVTVHNIGGDPRNTTIQVRRNHHWDSKYWYHTLFAHELAHAWQFRNVEKFSAIWGTEGSADWVSNEELRLGAGVPLTANLDGSSRLRNYPISLPHSGDFNYGYGESYPFLRFLVTRLISANNQTYESATNRVVMGVAEGWHGHHHLIWGEWNLTAKATGLTGRMREIIPDWDPVDARLEWMLSFAVDDRTNLSAYQIPFVVNAWGHFPHWRSLTLGRGQNYTGTMPGGGNFYLLIHDQSGEGGNVRMIVTSGEAVMAWKVLRYS